MKPFTLTASTLAGAWLTFASLATAQAPTSLALESPHTLRDQAPVTSIPLNADRHARLYWDSDEDGTVWVRGRNYKASFGSSGATYYPLFGSEQPRHFPVALSLSSATSNGQAIVLEPVTGAVRDGERVIIDRGPIDEIYEVGVDGIEQTFVVDGRPHGDLKLVAGIVTELAPGERADCLEFANEYGGVRYSRAFVRESAQVKRPLDTRLVEGGVAIDLDAQYLGTAQFPLVVDPLITTFGVAVGSPLNDFHPSVAYDVSTDHYLFVYEEGTSAFDGDVYAKLTDSTGAVLSEGYVDMTTEDWYEPSAANLNAYDQFLVVGRARTFIPSSGIDEVRGRLTNASALALGAKFTIASAGPGTIATRTAVGGDPYGSAPSYYCVCWSEYVGGNWDVRARLVTNLGTLFGAGPLILANTGVDEVEVAVSRSNGGTRWNVAWERTFDLRGAQIEWNGAITTPSFAISSSSSDSRPAPSSPLPNGDYVVAFERDFGSLLGYHDIVVVLVSGSSVSFPTSIQGLEAAGDQAEDQRYPAIDCDGHQFAVTYQRTIGSIHPQTFLTSFYVLDGAFGLAEGHIFLSWPLSDESQANVFAQHSAGASSRRYGLSIATVSNPSGPNLADIVGAFYDGVQGGPISMACFGDGTGTACPCANNGTAGRGCANSANSSGALLYALGVAEVSNDTVGLIATQVSPGAPCLFFQGTSLYSGGNGIVFGDGLLCAGGSITRMAVKFAPGTTAAFPFTGDPILSSAGSVPTGGGVRYYQVWYRDSAVFCSASTYNLTNAVKVVWLP